MAPEDLSLPEDICQGIAAAKEERQRRLTADAEAAAKREEAEAQAKRAQAERERKQALQLKLKDKAERELAAAIIQGGIALEDINPEMLRSPRVVEALEVARVMREVLAQASTAGHLQHAIDRAGAIVQNPDTSPSLALRALEVLAQVHFKLAGKPSLSRTEALKAVLVAEGATAADVAKMTTAELERRVAELTRGGSHGRH